jgi:hypothetical protein
MNSTIRSFQQNNLSMPPQQQQQYQTIYTQCVALKKDYDAATDVDLKNALRIVLTKKTEQMQSIWASYTSTINVQINSVLPS